MAWPHRFRLPNPGGPSTAERQYRGIRALAWAACACACACGTGGYIYSPQVSSGEGAASTQSAPTPIDSSGGSSGTGSATSTGPGSSTGSGTTHPAPVTRTCATTSDTFANFASAELVKSCNSCHTGEWNTVAKASLKAGSMRGQIASGAMPTRETLDSTVKQRLLTWLNCPTPLP